MKNKLLALSMAVAIVCMGCTDNKPQVSKPDVNTGTGTRMTVAVVKPIKKTVQDQIKTSGVVSSINEVSVASEIGGQKLAEVFVDVGQYVKKGQLLAALNTELLEKDIIVAEATLKKSKASLELSTFNYENSKKLRQSSAISEQELMQAKSQFSSNAAEVAQYQAQLDALRIKQKYARISAPVDGVISSKSAVAGTITNAGVELFKIIKDSKYEWKAEIDSEKYSALHINQKASFDWNGAVYEGSVSKISPSLDSTSKKLIVYVKPLSSKGLVGGVIVTGRITGAGKDIISLPESAILFDQGRAFVFKVQDGRVFKTPIEVGMRVDDSFEILTPIAPGDEFVKSGVGLLVDGDFVISNKEAQ